MERGKPVEKQGMTITNLPPIPEKLYFGIGEVAKLCGLQPHVLRYWEQEFSQLSPSKRRGNRRYYQRKDVVLIRRIRSLLYEQGYTIEGARRQLSGDVSQNEQAEQKNKKIKKAISGLEDILGIFDDD